MKARPIILAILLGPFAISLVCAQADKAPATARPDKAAADKATPLPPRHLTHGEAFNDGPRQGAYLMHTTGNVHFPITSQSPDAQLFFDQGIGQLHGFWYFEAERSFRQTATLDPNCAMSYWGMALANTNNRARARGFIAEAAKRMENASERERMYIDALQAFLKGEDNQKKQRATAYTRALEKILYEYPDDVEAKAFLALQIWLNRNSEIPVASHLAVDALLDQVFAVNPTHPAHHYRIHLWDLENPDQALASAARCGQTAPGIAHMWHMPGHIYSRVKRYDDACWQQEASARVDHAHMMRDRVLPDQIHNFAHNNEWLIRDLILVGRVRDAVDLAKNMIELPRHPKWNTLDRDGSAKFGRERLFQTLETFELWDELIALSATPYLEPTDNESEKIKRLRQLGSAQFRKGDAESGRRTLIELREQLRNEQQSRDQAGEVRNDPRKPLDARILKLERAVDEVEGHLAVLEKDYRHGLELLRKAGNVDPLYLALVQLQAGEADEALTAAERFVDEHKNEVPPLAMQVDLDWRAGKKDDSRKAFDALREISSSIDTLEPPLFARLAPIAKELGYPDDWRVQKRPATDVGVRPALADLGPFRWQPSPAITWSLQDAQGNLHTLSEFQGQPVVVIFYLGSSCLHCAEQLQKFASMKEQFEKSGFALVAISTDTGEVLRQAIGTYNDDKGKFPITLLANSELDIFKAYRCYDDFERRPLHGTFLIDGLGKVRWQDISHLPFMHPAFVLTEGERLLAQDSGSKLVASASARP